MNISPTIYNKVQSQLELLDENENNDRINFEEAFYSLSAKILIL